MKAFLELFKYQDYLAQWNPLARQKKRDEEPQMEESSILQEMLAKELVLAGMAKKLEKEKNRHVKFLEIRL